jgi:hypothetical protein
MCLGLPAQVHGCVRHVAVPACARRGITTPLDDARLRSSRTSPRSALVPAPAPHQQTVRFEGSGADIETTRRRKKH